MKKSVLFSIVLLMSAGFVWSQTGDSQQETAAPDQYQTLSPEPDGGTVQEPVPAPEIETQPASQSIVKTYTLQEDPQDLRARGQHQKNIGTAFLVGGCILSPVGLGLMVFNIQDYSDYTSDSDENSDAENGHMLFQVGDITLALGVAGIVVGAVLRSLGNKKFHRADRIEQSQAFISNLQILPVADFDHHRGGLVLAGNF